MTTATANSKITDEAQIRALIDDRAKAVRDKNVNEVISRDRMHLKNARKTGSHHSRARSGYEVRALSITAGDSMAFSHGLSDVSATRTDGDNSTCDGARLFASAKLTRNGWSRMSITRSP